MSDQLCPRCGNPATSFSTVSEALAAKIAEAGNTESLPERICDACFKEVASGVARGSLLHAKEKQKELQKLSLWKSRVNLLKKARQLMNEKNFSAAAVEYEKYLRILEMIFSTEQGMLTPEHFRESARTQELTVIAGVYWDLVRIYDTSTSYGNRMNEAAKKLTLFLRFTPVYPDIIRKAQTFQRKAKNPAIIKSFLKDAAESKGRCFIATAAFNSYEAPEVILLRKWRDEVLLTSQAGKFFVEIYYKISPPIAKILDEVPTLKAPTRALLRFLINSAIRH